MNKHYLYWYKAKYIKNYDGDSITFDIDLGLNIWVTENVRVYGVDTCEMREKDPVKKKKAKLAKELVKNRLRKAKEIFVKTRKDKKGKYGRYLVEVFFDGKELAKILISKGLGVPYFGGRRT